MFELSDDDDEFWEDLPLLDVTKKIESKNEIERESKRQCLEKENIESVNKDNNNGVNRQMKTQYVAVPSSSTSVLTNCPGTNLQPSAHGNKITCGFFTPVKSPEVKSDHVRFSEKSGLSEQMHDSISTVNVDTNYCGLHTQRNLRHEEITPNMPGDITHGEITPNMPGDITHGEITPNMPGDITHGEITPNMLGDITHGEITPYMPGGITHGEITPNMPGGITHGEITPNVSRDITHGDISTPNTPRNVTHGQIRTHTPNMPRVKTPGNITRAGTPVGMGVPGNVRTSSHNVPQETHGRRGKRKFPGPAGRLPKLKPGEVMNKSTSVSPESENKGSKDVIICSQINDEGFNESSWKILKQDLGPDAEVILHQFSVSSSLTMASKKTLPQGKIPLLFVVVESIDLHGAGGSVVLKDKTGRIKGTLHRDVIKEYGADIQPGTTLVLRQVGVVSPTNRTHYLNITPTNMVYLNSNASSLNKHLFHHHSLKHFMADFKRKRKQQQLGEDNSVGNGNAMPKTPQRFTNRMIQSVNSSSPTNCQPTTEHTPTHARHCVRAFPLNNGSCATGIVTPRSTLNCNQRAITPNSVNSRLNERFAGNLTASPTLNQRAITPKSVNSRLAAPISTSSAPVGNIPPRSTLIGNQRTTTPDLNFNQRDTTPDNCGTGTKMNNADVSSRLSLSSPSQSSQGMASIDCSNVKHSSCENANIAKFQNTNVVNQNQNVANSGSLMHGTCENLNFTDIRNSNHGYLNQNKNLIENSTEPMRTDTEKSSSCRIVPIFGKMKTNLNSPLNSKVTPYFPCSAQNKEDFNVRKTGKSVGNNSIVVTPKTSKFSFKSKTPSVSPSVRSVMPPCQEPRCQTGVSTIQTEPVDCDSLWQDDDISDEMLTHLTEDMP